MRANRAFVAPTLVAIAIAGCAQEGALEPSSSRSAPASMPSATPGSPDPSPGEPGETGSARPSLPVAEGEWERVLSHGDEGAFEVARDVVHGAAGFVAISDTFVSQEGGPRLTDRTMWISTDGRAWEEVEYPLRLDQGQQPVLTSTADGGYLVIYSIPGTEPGSSTTEALRSIDGRTWEPIATGLPNNLTVSSVQRGAEGWLIVGDVIGAGQSTSAPAAWHSADGLSWALVADLRLDGRWVRVADAAAGDEGFVIVGTNAELDGPSHQWFALASADGRQWVTATSPFAPEREGYQPDPHVAGVGADWVAALPMQDGSVQFWTSADGLEWTRGGQIPNHGPLEGWDPAFASMDGRVYFSATGGGYPYLTPGAWSSEDGTAWEALDLGADAYLGAVASAGGINVIVGTELVDPAGSLTDIWIAPTD